MPYIREGKCVYKKNADGSKGESVGCSESEAKAEAHMRALYANVKDSVFAEMSLAIVKASYNTNDPDPNKRMTFRMSSSDTGKDLADEAMSLELFKSFVERIHNKDIPEPFKSAICEDAWCGGMPYLSIAHYRAGGDAKNVPGEIEEVFVDGDILKSKGHCFDNSLGHAVFNSLLEDSHKRKSNVTDFDPVRVSIGFLDLKHKHLPSVGGQEYIFERKSLIDICPLCQQGIGGKIYLDGVLVHEAMTRVPMNPRTLMVAESELEEKSMADEIKSKSDDARSIVGDLADMLEEKSKLEDVLVVKSDGTTTGSDTNAPDPSRYAECYDPNTGGYNQDCIDAKVASEMVSAREQMPAVKSTVDKALLDGVYASILKQYKSNGIETPVMEVAMEQKMQLGGENIPVQPFKFDGVESPPHELNKAPVKAKPADEPEEEDNPKEEKKEMDKMHKEMKSAMDASYESLKSLVEGGKATAEEVNQAFAALGGEVEKSYTPPAAAPVDMNNLVDVIKSAVESAVAPLRVEIATLKAVNGRTDTVSKNQVPVSRALRVQPQDLINVTRSQVPGGRKLTTIDKLARKSTFAGSGIVDPLEGQY
jgi:hypothetical protein